MINTAHDIQIFVMGLLPKDAPDSVKESVRNEIDSLLTKFNKDKDRIKEEVIDDFCRDNNLCPICIRGGWTCGSDHK